MLVIPLVLLDLPMKTPVIIAAAVLTVMSAIHYVRVGIRVLG
jgi:hypothetical protein